MKKAANPSALCLLHRHRKPKWSVYEISNRDLSEIYFGIAMNPGDGLRQHRQRRVPETAHWDYARHRVRLVVLRSGLGRGMASATAAGLQQVRYPGQRVRRSVPFRQRSPNGP